MKYPKGKKEIDRAPMEKHYRVYVIGRNRKRLGGGENTKIKNIKAL
jgi:hypothetical protein